MRVLYVPQNSELSHAISEGQTLVQAGRLVWEDNGQAVVFPIKLSESRKRVWIQPVYSYKHTFDDLCRMFPSRVVEMNEQDYHRGTPSWGMGWYIADERGFPICQRSCWDTSD